MKILILGDSFAFNRSIQARLTNSSTNPACTAVRFGEKLIELEISVAEQESGIEIWALQALTADGIIFALLHNNQNNQNLKNLLIDPLIPSILICDNNLSPSPPFTSRLPTHPKRILEVDPNTGENCHLALLSLIYWIIVKEKEMSMK